MCYTRIGEVLRQTGQLSDMDVEEILQEQHSNPRRFGEIALAWGLCDPEDVWMAWFNQLEGQTPLIDIDRIGIDSQVITQVPRELAFEFNLVPLRGFDELLIAAVPQHGANGSRAEIAGRLKKKVQFVHAGFAQIQSALRTHYGTLETSGISVES